MTNIILCEAIGWWSQLSEKSGTSMREEIGEISSLLVSGSLSEREAIVARVVELRRKLCSEESVFSSSSPLKKAAD